MMWWFYCSYSCPQDSNPSRVLLLNVCIGDEVLFLSLDQKSLPLNLPFVKHQLFGC